jgi:sugar phosphate isomerase/epimerase
MHGRVRTLHVSDYDFIDERHRIPGDGINDWETIMSKLEELDYDGVFMYEVSRPRERDVISPSDVKKNYEGLVK